MQTNPGVLRIPLIAAPRIETKRLILRAAHADDHDAMAVIRANENVGRHIGGVRDPQDSWFFMLRMRGMWELVGFGYWVIVLKETGQVIGDAGFADFKREMQPDISGMPEAGWVLDEPHWGKGIMTEAVTATHHWLDTETDYMFSTCIITPDHTPSIRVAEKIGYEPVITSTYENAPITVYQRKRSF